MAKHNQPSKPAPVVDEAAKAAAKAEKEAAKAVPPTPVPAQPVRKVILMPDCRSFNLERYCDAGKKSVNCCGPDCRQYVGKPKPVAALLIAQLTKK